MYPWASFGNIMWERTERPLYRTDTDWKITPVRDQSVNLGSSSDSIVTLGIGSRVRSWEMYLTPARLAAHQALIGTTDTMTDWDRPTPDSRSAYLANVEPLDRDVAVVCGDGTTLRKIRARITFITQ